MALVDVRIENRVTLVTLNRPDVRNALNDALIAELADWATGASHDRTIRAAVLAGAGPVFCAGADLQWMSRMIGYSHRENLRDAAALARMFEALDTVPFPLIGRIQGAALGGGAGLAAVCDIAIAAEDVTFGFTEVKLGILPAVISPYVVAKIGVSAARELFLTGARFPASRAREIGLVHTVVGTAALDQAVESVLTELASSAPGAVAEAKALIRKISGRSPSSVMDITAETIARQRVSDEGQRGMRAFLEKRK
ncbi:MAG TPA: enoyl-CoA hydratase-related protein [Vicinamibacterales bacterium]|jgi:methylglutaconyl-CoA hydratase|nr:enoyl-CoA hydratase-related protein [Vicinamibacterales bacterium]